MKIVRVVVFVSLVALLSVQFVSLARDTAPVQTAGRTFVLPELKPAPVKKKVAAAKPKPAPKPVVRRAPSMESYSLPARYRDGKALDVSIRNQRLTAWEDGKVVMRLVISTGKAGFETPKGNWRINYKATNGWSRKYQVVMPWMMQFYRGYTIHQLAHERGSSYLIGRNQLGSPASHGCVRVNEGEAERLWRWTPTGTPLWIH